MRIYEKKTSGALTQLELKQARYQVVYWLLFVFLLLITVICLLPTIWVLLSAFKSTEEYLRTPPTFWPEEWHFEKLAKVWEKGNFLRVYFNTIVMAAGNLVFCILSCGLAGYVISRLKPKGSRAVFAVILWTLMMPNTVSQVPLFMTFLDFPYLHFNLSDTYFPMWMMAGANAFNILLFKSSFDAVPKSYIEAARIDGARNTTIFFRIVVPLSIPVIMVVSIFTINATWGDFFWPYLIIKEPSIQPLGLKIFELESQLTVDEYMTALLFSILPSVIIYLCLQDYIMKGVSVGGIKE